MASVEGSITLNELTLAEVDSDPSITGADLPIGSFALLGNGVDGRAWIKKGPNPTDWEELASSDSIPLHASTHNPGGTDPLSTASAITVGTNSVNAEGNTSNLSRSDHTHKVELASFSVRAINSVSTTSPTPVLLTDMTITPVAGTYIVHANFSATLSTNNTTVTGNIFSGGTLVADTNYSLQRGGGQGNVTLTYVMSCEITVNGSQAIEIHWERSAGTATATGRSLTITRKS